MDRTGNEKHSLSWVGIELKVPQYRNRSLVSRSSSPRAVARRGRPGDEAIATALLANIRHGRPLYQPRLHAPLVLLHVCI